MYGEAPYGHFPVDLLQSPNEKDTYIVRYTPQGVGLHKIHINFAGEPVQGSPYIVKVRNMTRHLPLLPNLLPNCEGPPPPYSQLPRTFRKQRNLQKKKDIKKWRSLEAQDEHFDML